MRSFAILLALAGTARAEPETTHYYQYTLPGDAVALALYTAGQMTKRTAGQSSSSTALTTLGILGGPSTPIVHMTRGHWKRGVASIALRAGLALIAGEIAKASADCTDECAQHRLMVGAGVGFALASIVDAAVLTKESVPAPPTWSPMVTARSGGVVLGLGRTF